MAYHVVKGIQDVQCWGISFKAAHFLDFRPRKIRISENRPVKCDNMCILCASNSGRHTIDHLGKSIQYGCPERCRVHSSWNNNLSLIVGSGFKISICPQFRECSCSYLFTQKTCHFQPQNKMDMRSSSRSCGS